MGGGIGHGGHGMVPFGDDVSLNSISQRFSLLPPRFSPPSMTFYVIMLVFLHHERSLIPVVHHPPRMGPVAMGSSFFLVPNLTSTFSNATFFSR